MSRWPGTVCEPPSGQPQPVRRRVYHPTTIVGMLSPFANRHAKGADLTDRPMPAVHWTTYDAVDAAFLVTAWLTSHIAIPPFRPSIVTITRP